MASQYQPLGKARYVVEPTFEGDQIKIKAPRQIFVLLFLPVWLAGWTVGGVAAIFEVFRHFEPFLAFWLCGWAVGWIFAAGTIIWMFTGSEILRVVGGDLEVTHRAIGFSRRWLYQGAMVRHLGVASQPAWPFRFNWQMPFFKNTRQGAIRFDYGDRTYFLAAGLDDAEGRKIVDLLAKRLPGSATTVI